MKSLLKPFLLGVWVGGMLVAYPMWLFYNDPGNLSGQVNTFVGGRADWHFVVFELGKVAFFLFLSYILLLCGLLIVPRPSRWVLTKLVNFLNAHLRPSKQLTSKNL